LSPWWKSSVVYQIYPRSFFDSDGDGVGDIPGIIERLDHIEALGADVVWVSPFYRSPQADNGYDVSDYQDVDPVFGTLADVDRLIAEVHGRGMRLVIDIVVNHTSDEHPWFVESRSSVDSSKRDWYWWRPPRDGMPMGAPGAAPNDWWTFFSEPAWEPDERTGEYYLHLFDRKQADLNWDNPQVREAIYAMLRWWLDRGVDGFRFDVINLISKQLTGADTDHFANGPRLHEFLAEMHREAWAGREVPLLTVGEMPGVSIDHARRYTDPANRELDMVFQFEHMEVDLGPQGRYDPAPFDLVRFKAVMSRWQLGLIDTGWNSLYWSNHDQPRPVSRYGDDSAAFRVASAKALATVMHLLRGTPYVYQGEELGMTNYPFTDLDQIDDVESRGWARLALGQGHEPAWVLAAINARGRDHARTPMQWDDSPTAGFSTGTPWLQLNPNFGEINAAAQVDDPDSVLAHYRQLIALRRELPVVVDGDFTLLLPDHRQVFAYIRRLDDDELLVIANLSSQAVEVSIPAGWDDSDVVVVSGALDGTPAGHLAPWEARVHRLNG
jgi:oligo-1,6-glucosidase